MKIICITPIKHIKGVYENLCSLGEVIYEPYITYDELKEKITESGNGITTIFTNPNKQNFKLDTELLKYSTVSSIITASTGLNHIDEYFKKYFYVYSLTTEYDIIEKISSTAEHAFTLMTSLIRNLPRGFDDVKKGNWDYVKFIGRQLNQLTIGIIGYGRLGKMMETYCNTFGMTVKIHDPYKGFDNLDDVLKSDIISLHVHVNDETRHMIDKKILTLIPKKSYIINTSRGEIVDEDDIIWSLRKGHLKGYATDVITDEYGDRHNSPILQGIKEGLNILVTPHVGGMTWEGQQKAYKWAIKKLETLL